MAQGYTGYNIIDNEITIKDSANLDAFSRFRVSNPLSVFNNQFTYDLADLVFEPYRTSNCSITHDATNRLAIISSSLATTGDFGYMQSYQYIPYQPGRSQLVFITFNMFPSGGVISDAYRYVGLGDNDNGFFFYYDPVANEAAVMLRSNTAAGPQIVLQSSWNLDKLDGSGASGITLSLERPQILVIDFQALYVGRVRFGFDIGGVIIYVHEFLNSNGSLLFPYMATANLPIRVGMEIYQVGTTTDMHFICCSVSSEGGVEDIERFGYGFVTYGNNGTVSGLTHLMTVRPKTTFKGYTNRTKFVLEEVSIMNTGNKAAQWYLGIGANLVGASWADANTNYSAFEYDTAATAPTPWTVLIDSGYTPAAAGNKNDVSATVISSKYPITLDAAGANRDEGQISLFAEDIGGSTSLYFALKWKEIR